MSTMRSEVPVLIVGAGPAGLTTSLALSRYGVGHLVVERHPGTAHTPRAHIVNQRTVEILRHLGIEDRLYAVATPNESMRNNLWVTSLTGREVARSEAWGTGLARAGEYAAASPALMVNCPQTVFEPLLLDAAEEAGSDIRFGLEFESATIDDDGITSTLIDRATGERHVVRSQYLLGADGARSRVLATAGLQLEGEAGLANAVNVWFKADLGRYLAHRPGVLTWNVMPGPLPPLRLGGLICHKPFEEFVLGFLYDPVERPLDGWTDDELIGRVRDVVGDPAIEVELKGVAGWQVNAQVATRYSDGRILCLGDAVHRHPPMNGLGLNMSVADAFNLSWKLALVLKGQAGAELLETYSQERQPVGTAGVQRAITSLGEMSAVEEALGLLPGQSAEEGWAALELLDAPGPEGGARRLALKAAVALTDRQFNAHGVELGYRYGDGALVTDDLPEVPAPADPVLHFVPTTAPGAHLPHARLERDGEPLSTLDLVEGVGFALLTGVGGEAWRDAAAAVEARVGVRVDVHVIGGHQPGDLADPLGEWAGLRETDTTGAVLVRPDRHVAWRAHHWSELAAAELSTAFDRVLRLPVPATTAAPNRAPQVRVAGNT